MHEEELMRRVEELRDKANEYSWGAVHKLINELYGLLTATPSDIRKENGGFWW